MKRRQSKPFRANWLHLHSRFADLDLVIFAHERWWQRVVVDYDVICVLSTKALVACQTGQMFNLASTARLLDSVVFQN